MMESRSNLSLIEDHTRRVRIDSARMDPRQRRVFEVYLAMGMTRTLPQLADWCENEGIIVSHSTLKKWSTNFGWAALIEQIEADLAEELGRQLLPDHVERTRKDMAHIQRMKLKFYERVERDEIDISVEEYIKLLKIEESLIGRPLDRPRDDELTGKYKVEIELTQEQLGLALAISASTRHNLPPPRNVTPIMIEHGESSNQDTDNR